MKLQMRHNVLRAALVASAKVGKHHPEMTEKEIQESAKGWIAYALITGQIEVVNASSDDVPSVQEGDKVERESNPDEGRSKTPSA